MSLLGQDGESHPVQDEDTLTMFLAQETHCFFVGIAVCVGLAVTYAVQIRFGKLKLPKQVFFLLLGMAFLLMAIMSRLEVLDDENFCRELKNINPDSVSNLVIRASVGDHAILSAKEISALFSQLQQVKAVPAHHSHPGDSFNFWFMLNGHEYQYRVARDSARPDEYWVFETARAGDPGREIGRIQSAQLKPVLEGLLANKP